MNALQRLFGLPLVAGVLVQGLFRNPLASPSVIGTSAGASLGGRLALLGTQWALASGLLPGLPPEVLLPAGCILGALGALAALFVVAEVRDADVASRPDARSARR